MEHGISRRNFLVKNGHYRVVVPHASGVLATMV
jgi:hypothetical protein